jgi:hypothetical protein
MIFFSSRQGGAQALADCVRAYGAEFLDPLLQEIPVWLSGLSRQLQPASTPAHQDKKARSAVYYF